MADCSCGHTRNRKVGLPFQKSSFLFRDSNNQYKYNIKIIDVNFYFFFLFPKFFPVFAPENYRLCKRIRYVVLNFAAKHAICRN